MSKEVKKKTVDIDVVAGARSFNRLDMQISQAVLFTIELYPQTNYIIVMDHYDDIAVFDDAVENAASTFYQMKTDNSGSMSMTTVLSEEWLPKLYTNFQNPKFIVKELGLITNVPITYKLSDGNNKKIENPKTRFSNLAVELQDKIKSNIATAHKINSADVDLSKFCHIKTTLSIDSHKDFAEKRFSDFLYGLDNQIDVKAVKTIMSTLVELLTKKQSTELVTECDFNEVLRHKSISKKQVEGIINFTLSINMPDFQSIWDTLEEDDAVKSKYAIAFSKLLEFQRQSPAVYKALLQEIDNINKIVIESDTKKKTALCKDALASEPKLALAHIHDDDKFVEIMIAVLNLKAKEEQK